MTLIKALLAGSILLAAGCGAALHEAATPARASKSTLYTACNIWEGDPRRAWYAFDEPADAISAVNYRQGPIIRAGTEVDEVRIEVRSTRVDRDGFPVLDGPKVLHFRRTSDGKSFWIAMKAQFHPGKTLADYRDSLFTDKPFGELTAGLSESEVSAIRSGVIVKGMSKRAVLVSAGVPPQHYTPSLDQEVWSYWSSRVVRNEVCFSAEGLATECADSKPRLGSPEVLLW